MNLGSFYITTPIYYVNDRPHVGHAYSTVMADVLRRYHALWGQETFFLTGTDEHGQKVAEAAVKLGRTPTEHVDITHQAFKTAWDNLDVKPDIFMRTTFPFHTKVVQEALSRLFEKGDIYKSSYTGWYCVSEEIFYTEKDLVDGKTPSGKPVEKVVEENYFFRMSKYQERLINYINDHPEFILPETRRNFVLNFLKEPLADLCITRPKERLSWGIQLPFDEKFVTYVWFDALLNYASAVGLYQTDKQEQFKKYWPPSMHLVGKDIILTHTVYWPTMLMALELELPKHVVAHGWWLGEGGTKMSKSEGKTVDPNELKGLFGVDPLRFFLMRGMHLGSDAVFSLNEAVQKLNTELAHNLGNLFARAGKFAQRFFDGVIPSVAPQARFAEPTDLLNTAHTLGADVKQSIEAVAPDIAIEHVVRFLDVTNRYFSETAPWELIKTDREACGNVIYNSLEAARLSAYLLSPVMPNSYLTIAKALGSAEGAAFESESKWGVLKGSQLIGEVPALFPRIILKK